jgi:hypothetical protein
MMMCLALSALILMIQTLLLMHLFLLAVLHEW